MQHEEEKMLSQPFYTWTGEILHNIDNEISVILSQSRWDNNRSYIYWIEKEILKPEGLNKILVEERDVFKFM